MAKTVQDNTINIFDNGIYDKGVRSKKLKQEYNQLTERIKDISHKIEYHRKNDDYAEATKLKRQQSDLENELVELDDKLNEENFKVTDEEFKEFYRAYNEEMSEFKAAHLKLAEEMNNKLNEVADIYRKMVENKNEAGRRVSREQYVKQEKLAPNATYNHYKGQIFDHEVNLDKDKHDTTPRGYAWKLEKKLGAVSRDDFQKYYYGHKQW